MQLGKTTYGLLVTNRHRHLFYSCSALQLRTKPSANLCESFFVHLYLAPPNPNDFAVRYLLLATRSFQVPTLVALESPRQEE